MKLAYISTDSISNRGSLSGTTSSVARALSKEFEVIPICPLGQRPSTAGRFLNFLSRHFATPSHLPFHTWKNIRCIERSVTEHILRAETVADALFFPSCLPAAAVTSTLPNFIYSDATVPGLCGYYPTLKNVSRKSYREACEIERCAYLKCTKIIFTSEWAKRSAVEYYGISPRKVAVVPRGANVTDRISNAELKSRLRSRDLSSPNILTVGREWYRKGMDVACSVQRKLIDRGFNSHLTLVGASPPRGFAAPPQTKVFPRLSLDNESDRAHLRDLYSSSTIFLLPTRAEAMGIVLAEAAAFGLPTISRATGGTDSAVLSGKTGFLVPENATSDDFVEAVIKSVQSTERHAALSIAGYELYTSTLNWAACGRALAQEISLASRAENPCSE